MSLIENLGWRYATKKYNSAKKVADQDVLRIVEAARLAPSSYGIQPYQVIAISNQELKSQIVPIAWNQQIVGDCSHLLVFAAWDSYDEQRIQEIFDHTTQSRGLEKGTAFGSRTQEIINSQVQMNNNDGFIDAAKQTCIAFGMAIAQAAELKIDNTPMGGFDPTALDALLGLDKQGLKSVYLLALGYREDKGDWLSGLKKVRTPIEHFLREIK